MENNELVRTLKGIRVMYRGDIGQHALSEAIRLLEWRSIWIAPTSDVDLLFDDPEPYHVTDCWRTASGSPFWYQGVNWASRRTAGRRATDKPVAWRPSY